MRTFSKMGNCKRTSLTHRTMHSHQVFRCAKQMWALVNYQVCSGDDTVSDVSRAKLINFSCDRSTSKSLRFRVWFRQHRTIIFCERVLS